ncbi:MAG: hypothetical protein ACYCSB_08815 [bacterium]|jgi:hypothetical protein
MKRRFLLIILFFVVSVPLFYLSGCSVFSSLGIPPAVQSSGGYKSALRKATRKADIYNKLNTVMYIRATYFNKSFVRAYEKEYYNYYMKKPEGLKDKTRKYVTLLVSVYTPRKSYNNLDSKRSIWMVYLSNNEGESVMPVSIKPSQEKRVFLKKFFPYVTNWSKQYIMKFPIYYDKKENKPFLDSSVKWIKLVITGVNGKAVLTWNINAL